MTAAAVLLLGLLLVSCGAPTPAVATPVLVVKALATVYISPTPDEAARAATRAAASPTAAPPTPTPIPSPTAYVGVFLGRAEREMAFQPFSQPILGSSGIAEPTANAAACRIPISPAVLRLWQNNRTLNDKLGCPIQQDFGFFGTLQVFERGVMYAQNEINAVWAIVPQATAGRFFYMESPPALTLPERAPAPLLAPTGNFGSVWAIVPDLRQRLGYAIAPEVRAAINLQRFDSGIFLMDLTSGQAFALIVDGTAYGPFQLDAQALTESLLPESADPLALPTESADN